MSLRKTVLIDLIVFDPPFRWFQPRDLLETAITDENYQSLTSFMTTVIDAGGFSKDVVSQSDLGGEWSVSYFVFRLTAARRRYHNP